MINENDAFEEGYKYIPGTIGSNIGDHYINNINDKIKELSNSINSFKGDNTPIPQLKGDVFEMWHSGTYNIDATIKTDDPKLYVEVPRSHGFASPDIITSWKEWYGLKNCSDSKASAKAQAISFFEYYSKTRAISKTQNIDYPSIEEYFSKKGYHNIEQILNDPIYKGQKRLIPSDQVDNAIEWLRRKVSEESINRPQLAQKYKDTLDNIIDRIKGPKNTESIPIDKNISEQIAAEAKSGVFDPSKYGITTEELVKLQFILEKSVKAGVTAAVITFTLKMAPEVIKILKKIIKDENISQSDMNKFGLNCISATGRSFINGTIASIITASLKAGYAGEIAKDINPIFIGTATVLAINTFSNALKMAMGNMSQTEFGEACMKDIFIATISTGGAILGLSFIPNPYLGALIGNVLGGIVGAILYPFYNNAFLSFCADTGYTFLGFVEQNYLLPVEVLRDMGMDIVQMEVEFFNECKPDTCEFEICSMDICEPKKANKYFIKRGVIGVNKIGYILC